MSMLTSQVEGLREAANRMEEIGISVGYGNTASAFLAHDAVACMREAAYTIESLRDRLQEASDGCKYCKGGDGFDGQKVMMSNHGWQVINCCPNCGRKVVDV